MSSRMKPIITAIAILVGVWIIGKIWVAIYPDWLWFSALGYISVYKKILFTKILMWVLLSAFFLIVSLVNLYLIRRFAPQSINTRIANAIPTAEEIGFDLRKYLYLVLAVIISGLCLLMGYIASDKWEIFLRYFNSVDFGTNDPLFSGDVGYYVFKMPFLKSLYGWSFALFLLTTLLTIALYFFHGAIISDRNQFEPPRGVRAHLFSLIGITLLLKAWGYRFTMYYLLYSSGTSVVKYGAGFAEAHARLPILWIMLVLCIITALAFFVSIFIRKIRYALVCFALLFIAAFIGRMYPGVVQQFQVKPNEQDKERQYIEHNVNFTRKAYNLDRIETNLYPIAEELTLDSIKENVSVMENIRLWDWRPLRRIYRAVEEPRPVYEYVDVDIDRYMVGGRLRQVMLAAREANYDKLERQGKSWFRRTFIYTHGYGLSMSPVKEIIDGNPKMYIEKIPLKYALEWEYKLPEDPNEPGPRIYYGERTNYYAIVNPNDAKPKEFDYPTGEAEEKYNSYKGRGGVPLVSFWRKVLYALKFRSYNILLSEDIKEGSRILYDRKIKDRVRKVAPFLKYDEDPYLVVHEGRLFWILDAYTTTNLYPYSEPTEDIYRQEVTASRGINVGRRVLRREIPWGNYVRNSIKVVIDAYDGKINFYIMGNERYPIAECYRKIFGGLLKSFAEMPDGLKEHIRYPLAMFWIQALKYEYYHMQDITTFYNETDLWKIGTEVYDNTDRPRQEEVVTEPISRFGQPQTRTTVKQSNVQPVEPYYVVLNLPGKQEAEFLLILPFIPKNKEMIMSAWLAAKCDEEDYGKLLLYQFPKEAESISSPMRIEEYISRKAEISKELTLWDTGGSRVLRGNLLVIPMNESLLYVEPIYIQSEQQSAIPKLERVIIGYKDDVAMGATLDDALMKMFGEGVQAALPIETTTFIEDISTLPESTTPTATAVDTSIQNLTKQARQQYDQAQAAQRAGKWSEYGAKIKELERTLKLLEEKTTSSR
ncbi:UPF0182 family protein [bacterium]|nr:UPF0182 family protein [bacterium]